MKISTIALSCLAFYFQCVNVYAADAVATGGATATGLNTGGTTDTAVGNSTGSTTINGVTVNISGPTSSTISSQGANSGSYMTMSPSSTSIVSQSYPGGVFSTNSYIDMNPEKIEAASGTRVTLSSGPVDGFGGVNGTSLVTVTPTQATIVSSGTNSYTALGWGANSGTYTNGIQADSTGTLIQSATAITLSATTNNISGTTNINTTGNSSTSIGNSGTGSVTITSGTNSLVLNNSGTTLTSPTTIVGITNINSTGTANTSIGNNSGVVSISGSAVNIGSNSSSSIVIGNSSGNSSISMNGNRIQNVANAVAGTDAVNLNQLNSVSGNVANLTNQVSSLSNQLQQSQTEYRGGIASVAAMNGIGSLNGNQKVNLGLGIGSFAGQAGVAIGGNVRLAENVTFKASVATANSNTAASGGLTIGF